MNTAGQHGQNIANRRQLPPCLLFNKAKPPLLKFAIMILGIVLAGPASAHRGGSDEVDPCRIQVGDEWIHFAAYTPKFSENKSYCRSIPKVGMTNLVFDYEGKKLRQVSIEFEVTKEPEGARVFYRPPDRSKYGTVDGSVDFSQFGPGNYQVHVTLVDKDKKLDTHIPFSVGIEGDESYKGLKKVLFTVLVCAVIIYLSYKLSRGKDDDTKARETPQ